MKYYGILFEVKKGKYRKFNFNSCNLFKDEEDAKDPAEQFIANCSEPDEKIEYEIQTYVLVEL